MRTPEAAATVEAYKAARRDVLAIEELRAGRHLTDERVPGAGRLAAPVQAQGD